MATRILVINDERAILELIEEILVEEGYEVYLEERVDLSAGEVEHLKPDLIILDYLFGTEALGLQLVQQLKLKRSTASIPLILCTAATELVKETAPQLNAKGVELVFKPFEIDELLEAVKRGLRED